VRSAIFLSAIVIASSIDISYPKEHLVGCCVFAIVFFIWDILSYNEK